jgi:hypothetical protein
MSNQKIELGDKVRDKVTGFEGIVTGRYSYLSGCDRFGVQGVAIKGEVKEAVSFDEVHLEVIKKAVVKRFVANYQETGGPRPEPARRHYE